MATLHARVKDGHIVVDEKSDLPEGTVVTLQLLDGGDEMTDEELADLEAEVDRARADIAAGRGISADELLALVRAT
jgi:hypothetical protein